ncbi:MAG: FixG Ig-like domain-containing protein, partial [Flammeovirgaceae bacterium]
NLFTFQVVNKTTENLPIELKIESHDGELVVVGGEIMLKGKDVVDGAFLLKLSPELLDGVKTKIRIGVYTGGEQIELVTTNFMGPYTKK